MSPPKVITRPIEIAVDTYPVSSLAGKLICSVWEVDQHLPPKPEGVKRTIIKADIVCDIDADAVVDGEVVREE